VLHDERAISIEDEHDHVGSPEPDPTPGFLGVLSLNQKQRGDPT
jgi:hypothetical protein